MSVKDRLNLFVGLSILIILTFIISRYLQKEYFENTNSNITIPNTTKPIPIERTKLYGSLFLDNINTVIQNLTKPKLYYENK